MDLHWEVDEERQTATLRKKNTNGRSYCVMYVYVRAEPKGPRAYLVSDGSYLPEYSGVLPTTVTTLQDAMREGVQVLQKHATDRERWLRDGMHLLKEAEAALPPKT